MSAALQCPKCGAVITPGTPAAECPGCLFGMAQKLSVDGTADLPASVHMKNRRVGDYILGSQLASGGMGVVYEAHQVSLNRKVALKFIRDSQLASPALLCRFTIEAEAAARL